jgi:hypothetical protein
MADVPASENTVGTTAGAQNSWLNNFGDVFEQLGTTFSGVYSSFMGAQTTKKIADSQLVREQRIADYGTSPYSPQSSTPKLITYAAVGVALVATIALLIRMK